MLSFCHLLKRLLAEPFTEEQLYFANMPEVFSKFTKYNKILKLSDKKPVIRGSLLNLLENGKTLIN